jgi:hypothetical protein
MKTSNEILKNFLWNFIEFFNIFKFVRAGKQTQDLFIIFHLVTHYLLPYWTSYKIV